MGLCAGLAAHMATPRMHLRRKRACMLDAKLVYLRRRARARATGAKYQRPRTRIAWWSSTSSQQPNVLPHRGVPVTQRTHANPTALCPSDATHPLSKPPLQLGLLSSIHGEVMHMAMLLIPPECVQLCAPSCRHWSLSAALGVSPRIVSDAVQALQPAQDF